MLVAHTHKNPMPQDIFSSLSVLLLKIKPFFFCVQVLFYFLVYVISAIAFYWSFSSCLSIKIFPWIQKNTNFTAIKNKKTNSKVYSKYIFVFFERKITLFDVLSYAFHIENVLEKLLRLMLINYSLSQPRITLKTFLRISS